MEDFDISDEVLEGESDPDAEDDFDCDLERDL